MNKLATFAAIVVLIGCGKDDGGDDNPTDDTDQPSTAIQPAEGTWAYGDVTVVDNGCDFEDVTSADLAPLAIADVTETGFSALLGEEGGGSLACTLGAQDDTFTCESLIETDDFNPEADVVLTVANDLSGDFTDENTGTLNWTVSASCEGADCEAFSAQAGVPLPCASILQVAISHEG